MLANPSNPDLLLAACIFSQCASWSNLRFAVIGGLSAIIYGSQRRTKSLDILLAPRQCGDKLLLRPVIDELFDRFPQLLNYSLPGKKGHIVLTQDHAGVAVNFIDCINNIYDFPDIVSPYVRDGPEPTVCYQQICPPHIPQGVAIPVVVPRLLLQQRILHFDRPNRKNTLMRKRNDVNDIAVYLNALQCTDNESFTDEEAATLLPKIRGVLRFAETYFLKDAVEVGKWLYLNIPLVEGDWKS